MSEAGGSSANRNRTVRRVVGSVKMPLAEKAREVVAEYDDGERRREIEVAVNGQYAPVFAEVDDFD